MDIERNGTQAVGLGDQGHFTGTVRVESLFQAHAPARTVGARVTFDAGARTAWHSHPLGQILIVTAGTGFVQAEGGPVEEIHIGDVIWTAPGEKHWHGASAKAAMTHLAIMEQHEGMTVRWMDPVSDEEYARATRQTA